MYIGFTERGDAGIDLSWKDKLLGSTTCQGAVLITKNITKGFRDAVVNLVENDFPFIIHATITGWGGTAFEPNVPDYKTELWRLKDLIIHTFAPDKIVLRIDPIFPTEEGLKRIGDVLECARNIGLLPCRVRISIYDEYPHVRERLKAMGKEPLYNGAFYAPHQLMKNAAETLAKYAKKYNITFETCAEPFLVQNSPDAYAFKETGCLSIEDIKRMGLNTEEAMRCGTNSQNRGGCKCLRLKYELLTNRKQCPHKCVYCYWKDNALPNLTDTKTGVNLSQK